MQVKSTPRELLAGDPMCAPAASAISEALVILIRRLLGSAAWAPHVSAKMCATLDVAAAWHAAKNMSVSVDSQGGGRKNEEQSVDSAGELEELGLFGTAVVGGVGPVVDSSGG